MSNIKTAAKIYTLPTEVYTMDEQIRTSFEESSALQAECSTTLYGIQMAAELVKRYNCHVALVKALHDCRHQLEIMGGKNHEICLGIIQFSDLILAKAKEE